MKSRQIVLRLDEKVTAQDEKGLLEDVKAALHRIQKNKKLFRVTVFHPPVRFEDVNMDIEIVYEKPLKTAKKKKGKKGGWPKGKKRAPKE